MKRRWGVVLGLFIGSAALARPGENRFKGGLHIKLATLSPLPEHVRVAITNRHAEDFYYVTKQNIRPTIYRRTGNTFASMPFQWLKPRTDLSADELRCFHVFLSGSATCLSGSRLDQIADRIDPIKSDLLAWARQATPDLGLTQTRDVLARLLQKRDPLNGELERRVRLATANPRWATDDSAALDAKLDRHRIGIFFLLGIDVSDHSPSRDQIRDASAYAKRLGFYSHTFETGQVDSSFTNAEVIAREMPKHLAKVDQVIVVGASKGIADFLHWTFLHSNKIAAKDRSKVRMVISLCGAIREAFVADWILSVRRFNAKLQKTLISIVQPEALAAIGTLSQTPWRLAKNSAVLRQQFPRMRWISFAMLPEAVDGLSYLDPWSVAFQEQVYREGRLRSPSDGLMETAASILPPGTGIEEHVIRGFGPHALSIGHYIDMKKIAPHTQVGHALPVAAAGPEIIDAFIRSMPSAWLK